MKRQVLKSKIRELYPRFYQKYLLCCFIVFFLFSRWGSPFPQNVCICPVGSIDTGNIWPGSLSCSGVCQRITPTISPQEYGFWYYPKNMRPTGNVANNVHEAHFLTGYYGLAFDPSTITSRFGIFTNQSRIEVAKNFPNTVIYSMLPAIFSFRAGANGSILATGLFGFQGSTSDRMETRDAGKFMNQLDVTTVKYTDVNLCGYVKISSAPRHFVYTHGVTKNFTDPTSSNATSAVRIVLSGQAIAALTNVTWILPNFAVRMTNSEGQGWIFIVYDQASATTSLSYNASTGLIAAVNVSSTSVPASLEISLLAIPSTVSSEDLKVYLNPTSVIITSALLDKNGNTIVGAVGANMLAIWDRMHGVFQVPTQAIANAGGTAGFNYNLAPTNYEYHNLYNRHRITVQINETITGAVSIPLGFISVNAVIGSSVTAGIALFRDRNGEPLGVPIQMSKNWHTSNQGADGHRWYHLYSTPIFAGPGVDTMELTFVTSRWGQAHAAQHAQLSLMGYNYKSGGHWQESSIGPVGESITYDPDLTLGRAMVDDIRPFLNLGNNYLNQLWQWTGNVGGADFLAYVPNTVSITAALAKRRLGRVRTNYVAHGPTLTDVEFTGISSDEAIQGNIRTQLSSSNDILRCYYILNYTFLMNVNYNRLSFFQFAADNYADNGYSRYAYGNETTVAFDGDVPALNVNDYTSNANRGISLPGASPWVLLYKSTKRDALLADWPANTGE